MKKVWEFALTAKQASAIAICLTLAILLFSAAGFVAGLIVAGTRAPTLAVTPRELPKPALPALADGKGVDKPAVPAAKEETKAPAPATQPPAPPEETKASAATAPAGSAPAPAAASPAAALTANAKSAPPPIQIEVQVGSFSKEDNARNVLEHLKQVGYPATSFSMTDAHNRQWHVVQVGPYADYDNASRIALELSGKYRVEPRLVPQTEF
jgi:cell division septation protein DedD